MELQGATDRGFWCTLALRASQLWDFVDKRDIDKHAVSLAILCGAVWVLRWAMRFAEVALQHAGPAAQAAIPGVEGFTQPAGSGFEAAAVITAVTAPYMAMQAMALKFYFETRSK